MLGEWNGLLHVLTVDTPEAGRWGTFDAPRAYTRWIEPVSTAKPDPAFGLERSDGASKRSARESRSARW
jgi:hypothetical protein